MRTSKKILSVVMALMMLLSVLALSVYAFPSDTVAELTLEADKTSYAAGDEITLTVYCQTNDEVGGVEMMGQYIMNYDSTGIASLADESTADAQAITLCGFTPDATQASVYNEANSKIWNSNVCEGLGDSADAGDKLFGLSIVQVGDAYVNAQSAPVALFTFKMKVADTAPDGDYVIAFNASSLDSYNLFVQDDSGAGLYGTSGTDFGFAAANMWSLGSVTIHVGASGPAVAFQKAQVKMALKEGALDTTVADPIQLRVTSVITAADFDAYFANTTTHGTDAAPTASAITSVGIVAYKGAAADFNEATAKALVTDGTEATNYAAAETDYISNASGDYTFGAIIKGSRADAFAADVTFLGFVKYLDASGNAQVIFYDTATTKTITDATVNAYIAANS